MLVFPVYEDVPETLARANAWIAISGIHVLNVETVVLPDLDAAGSWAKAVNHAPLDG